MLRATQVPPEFDWVLTYGAVTLYGGSFQNSSVNLLDLLFYPIQTELQELYLKGIVVALQPQTVNRLVWALPRSLAATCRISSISFPLLT